MDFKQLSPDFFSKSTTALSEISTALTQLPSLKISDLDKQTSALVVVDLIKGFATEGPLYSPRVGDLVQGISNLVSKFKSAGLPVIAFADSHDPESPEFLSYPPHCLKGSDECALVDELPPIDMVILKNSTNGFLEPAFQNWLASRPQISNFIIVGDCTDICIEQFAKTLKAHFNRQNLSSRIIVPVNAVETFDLGNHYAELMNMMALYSMMQNGIEVVAQVE